MLKCKKCGKEASLIANLCRECDPDLHEAWEYALQHLNEEQAVDKAQELVEKEKHPQ